MSVAWANLSSPRCKWRSVVLPCGTLNWSCRSAGHSEAALRIRSKKKGEKDTKIESGIALNSSSCTSGYRARATKISNKKTVSLTTRYSVIFRADFATYFQSLVVDTISVNFCMCWVCVAIGALYACVWILTCYGHVVPFCRQLKVWGITRYLTFVCARWFCAD